MEPLNIGGSSSLPTQKVSSHNKNQAWKEACVNYYINFRYTNGSNLRSDRARKIINYDLYNGVLNQNDVQKMCDPLMYSGNTWADRFQHYDQISKPVQLLIGEEIQKPDIALVVSESPEDLNRKQRQTKEKIINLLKQQLLAEIDPSTIDPNNPPPTPDQVLKAERYSPSDIIESKANKILKILKKRLNTKWYFTQGFKDALIAGEEVYWSGILNGEPALRKCNPLNTTIILDDDSTFVDDAIAIVEERMLTIPSIIDEYGEDLDNAIIEKLQTYSKGVYGTFNTAGGYEPVFTVANGTTVVDGSTPTTSFQGNNVNNYALRVTRVEWISMKQVGTLTYTDPETEEQIEKLVDESFRSSFKEFKEYNPDAEIEWFWINEAWEGVKIAHDIYIGIKPKANQRRRMDNPYYCKLGYTGFIYDATNSRSVSLVDRIKPYQYLYDVIAFRLELAFASDQGKVFLMDLAQIPRSEGIDIEKWIYYLKEMKIGFINSFEEGKKGMAQGKLAGQHFNQFQSIDLSLSQSIQQYINFLEYIKQQIYFISGVNQQRMGNIKQDEAVGNVERAQTASATITEYLFDAHQEVKRRVYTSLIEVAKLCWKNGLVTQYVNDDLSVEMLNLEEFEFENSEFSVFVSNLSKDREIKNKLEQLAQVALQAQKADLSTIIETILNDSPKDIIALIKKGEEEFYQREEQRSKSQQEHEQMVAQMQQQHEQELHDYESSEKQKDRDLQQYIADSNNQTKIQTAEISALGFAKDQDVNKNMIPDVIEQGRLALSQQELSHNQFIEQQRLGHEKTLKEREHSLKEQDMKFKKEIEDKKIKAIEVQNKNQIELANKKSRLDEKMANKKIELEKLKIKAKSKTTNKK